MATLRAVPGELTRPAPDAGGLLQRVSSESLCAGSRDSEIVAERPRGSLRSAGRGHELKLLERLTFERDPGAGCHWFDHEQFNRLYLMRDTGFRNWITAE